MRSKKYLLTGVMLLSLLLMLCGCSGDTGSSFEASDLYGTWETSVSKLGLTADISLTLNENGNFEAQGSGSGYGQSLTGEVSGSWKMQEGYLYLTPGRVVYTLNETTSDTLSSLELEDFGSLKLEGTMKRSKLTLSPNLNDEQESEFFEQVPSSLLKLTFKKVQ